MNLERHTATRDRRLALVDNHQAGLTARLRALAGSGMELRDAAAVVQRYARGFCGVHLSAGAAEDIARLALSAAADRLEIEALDELILFSEPAESASAEP